MAWQPIETADRTSELLLFFPKSPYGATGKCFHQPMQKVGRPIDFLKRKPTHWMPLPEPPKERQ